MWTITVIRLKFFQLLATLCFQCVILYNAVTIKSYKMCITHTCKAIFDTIISRKWHPHCLQDISVRKKLTSNTTNGTHVQNEVAI